MTHHWILALFLILSQSSLPAASFGVEFPDGYNTAPYDNNYRFDQFNFHSEPTFGVHQGKANFPDRAPFVILKQFFATLANSDPSTCSAYFHEWNSDIANGLNSLKNMSSLELVADWKQDAHWVVIMSKEGNRGQSMIPFVMKDNPAQKFITDARFLGDFMGLLGQFLAENPKGILTVVEYSSASSEGAPAKGDSGMLFDKISVSTYLIVSTVLALLVLAILYVVKRRK